MVKLRDSKSDGDNGDKGERLSSLDAVRGLFLLLLISNGFGLRKPEMLNQDRWGWLTDQWAHRPWEGCTPRRRRPFLGLRRERVSRARFAAHSPIRSGRQHAA